MDSKNYFETVAPRWETMRQGFFSDDLRRIVIESAGVQAGQVAVDVGAGSGFLSRGLAAKGACVIAVDRSPAMLEELRTQLPQVDVRQGEAEKLPVPDNGADYVFANMYLHHVEDPAAAVREMVRILRPGGKLLITDLDRHTYEFLRTEHHDRWLGFERNTVQTWFQAAGLEAVSVACAEQKCCAASQCGAEKAAVSIFMASGIKAGSKGEDQRSDLPVGDGK
jgi:ubiquinone/menaquinone biosynthesis C-methylase UbiE